MRVLRHYFVALVVALFSSGCGGDQGDSDLGHVWCEMELGSYEGAVAVSFPDPLIGTYVNGIYRSTDGGMNWTPQQPPGAYTLPLPRFPARRLAEINQNFL